MLKYLVSVTKDLLMPGILLGLLYAYIYRLYGPKGRKILTIGTIAGFAASIVMSVVKGRMTHGPLRIIFTTDEEIDMSGVLAITPVDMEGVEYLINIDSEQSDTLTVSSAADATVVLTDDPCRPTRLRTRRFPSPYRDSRAATPA